MKYIKKFVLIFVPLLFIFYNHAQSPCSLPPGESTVFTPQQISQSLSLEMAMHNFAEIYKVGVGTSAGKAGKKPKFLVDVSAFYFRSFDPLGQAASIFPNQQTTITVAQDNNSNVSSPWLGIVAPLNKQFKSQVCISPLHEVMGGTFKIMADFGGLFPDTESQLKNMYTSWYVALIHVRNNLNFVEQIQGGLGMTPGLQNVTQALNNPMQLFGKFPTGVMKSTAPDDMQWRVGWVRPGKSVTTGLYWVLFIPLGHLATATEVFEPVIGNQGHYAPGLGISQAILLWKWPHAQLDLIWELRWNYLLPGTERRIFNLKNGDWSEYLLVTVNGDNANPLPGINFFTRDAVVHSRNMIDWITALNYQHCQYIYEFGYELWYHQSECVELCENSQPFAAALSPFGIGPGQGVTLGIYDLTGCCPKFTLSNATICQGTPGSTIAGDNTFVPITNEDLNLATGTKGTVIFMKMYGGMSYAGKTVPGTLGACWSAEFSVPLRTMKQFGVWLKANYAW